MSFNIRFVFYWVIHVLWSKLRIWQINLVDSVFYNWLFFLILSFNIVFDWKLSFIIYFGLIFIGLFQPNDSGIVLNGLTYIDLALFFH